MGDALKAWAKTSKVRTKTSQGRIEALLARVEKYKRGTSSKAMSAGNNDFSITKCMTTLQNINLLDYDKYLKVVEKFTTLKCF